MEYKNLGDLWEAIQITLDWPWNFLFRTVEITSVPEEATPLRISNKNRFT